MTEVAADDPREEPLSDPAPKILLRSVATEGQQAPSVPGREHVLPV